MSEDSRLKSKANLEKNRKDSAAKDGSIIVESDSEEVSSNKSLVEKSGNFQTLQV